MIRQAFTYQREKKDKTTENGVIIVKNFKVVSNGFRYNVNL